VGVVPTALQFALSLPSTPSFSANTFMTLATDCFRRNAGMPKNSKSSTVAFVLPTPCDSGVEFLILLCVLFQLLTYESGYSIKAFPTTQFTWRTPKPIDSVLHNTLPTSWLRSTKKNSELSSSPNNRRLSLGSFHAILQGFPGGT
jgi:hypothetical protein